MKPFNFLDGRLHAEGVSISRIAETVGTPFYCYSSTFLEEQYDALSAALKPLGVNICYAIKANSNQAVIRTFANKGSGADVVSKGELIRALNAGIPPNRIIFSGVGKTSDEIRYALKEGIGQFNVESAPELEAISGLAEEMGSIAPVALRVNPDVDAQTHDKIATGRKADKFGIDIALAASLYSQASRMRSIRLVGLAVHIGSQLTSLEPFRHAFNRLGLLVNELRSSGFKVERLDLGGGLGVVYTDENPPEKIDYAGMLRETLGNLDTELSIEPGRILVANAGILVTRVIYVKKTPIHRFVIVDAAMNDFLRPTLYDAVHRVMPETVILGQPLSPAQVVGPVCETGDILAKETSLPPLNSGDLIAISSAGAYGAVMGSTYNTRLTTPEVMVRGKEISIIRPRPEYSDILSLDQLPTWL